MLIYTTSGIRHYGEHPIAVTTRRCWEFQAVLRGRIAPVYLDGPSCSRGSRLWLFSPSVSHGWTAAAGSEAEMAVFHFLSIPRPLEETARASAGALEVTLDKKSCRRLRHLSARSLHHLQNPSPATMMYHEQALMELSLLVYESEAGKNSRHASHGSAWQTVQRVMEIYTEAMHENPSQSDLARRAGCSVSHMRRLFHDVLQASPKHTLDQMRFQRAIQLMSERSQKLETVGEMCGFESASAFSRAFKNHFSCSPAAWLGELGRSGYPVCRK